MFTVLMIDFSNLKNFTPSLQNTNAFIQYVWQDGLLGFGWQREDIRYAI
jgi:hypothetical protein